MDAYVVECAEEVERMGIALWDDVIRRLALYSVLFWILLLLFLFVSPLGGVRRGKSGEKERETVGYVRSWKSR